MTGRLQRLHAFGMEPDIIAERVIEAIGANRFHIFSHPEFRDELRELFDDILADFRDYPNDPGFDQRVAFEQGRRESYRTARATAQGDG